MKRPGAGLGARELLVLFAVGVLGGLIGDMCHVESGTTAYLDDPLPYVWRSQIWFPLLVGSGTAAIGWIRVASTGGGRPRASGFQAGRAIEAIASILALYALTAVFRGEPDASTITLVWSCGALICARFAQGWIDLGCAALAAVVGVGTEIALASAGAFTYAGDVPQLAGVAAWLPALYLAFGVVAGQLGLIVSRRP